MKAQKGSRGVNLNISLTSALDGSGWSTPRPGRFTPGKDSRCQSYRKLGGAQGRSGRMRKISLLLEFDVWTSQPVSELLSRPGCVIHTVRNNVII